MTNDSDSALSEPPFSAVRQSSYSRIILACAHESTTLKDIEISSVSSRGAISISLADPSMPAETHAVSLLCVSCCHRGDSASDEFTACHDSGIVGITLALKNA